MSDNNKLMKSPPYNKKTILIIGITGFLGRNLTKYLIDNYKKYNIIGTGLSSNKIKTFENILNGWGINNHQIPVHMIDIVMDPVKLETIFKNNKVDYVIHCAALKYICISEKQPEKAIEININGTLNILKLAKKYNITNLIGLSTDKANKPINTYGMTKYLMEELIKEYKYSIYQGVNFFWSDGSVLDIWLRQIRRKDKLCVTNFEQERYYSNIFDICEDIITNLDNKNQIITSSKIFKIRLLDLFKGFIKYFNYDEKNCNIVGYRKNEKELEDLLNNTEVFENLKEEEIIEIIKFNFEHCSLSF